MIRNLRRRLSRLASVGTLRARLLCLYFLLVALPLGVFSVYTNFRVRDVVQEQTLSAAQNAFDDRFLAMAQIWSQLDEVIDILATDPLVYTISSNDPKDFTHVQRLQDSVQLGTSFAHLRILSGVDRIRLYVHNNYSYSSEENSILPVSQVAGSTWYRSAQQARSRFWCAPTDLWDQPAGDQNWFSTVQTIYNPRSILEPLAILRADLNPARLSALINETSITENGMLMLLRNGEILLASHLAEESPDAAALARRISADSGEGWKILEENGTEYYAQCRPLNDQGWYVASVLPARDIYRPGNRLRSEMLWIVAALTLMAYMLAYLLSRSTLDRLSLLSKTMHAVEKGDTAARLEPAGDDEIAQLMGSFNQMMDRMDALMEDKVEYGRQIKNLELKALQAQINPHFLYNSLDLINCTAIHHHIPQISQMVSALSKFYRLSLSKGREIISLNEEVQHAKAYLQIQNLRFDNRIQARWDLDPSAGDCRIIKIILQPLIENAVIHGIFEKPSKAGCLTVTTRRSDDGIRITICDDGVGMDEATRLANFTASTSGSISQTSGGYGVRNIHDRIKLAYGDDYGLSCVSTPGQGTTVTVHIPAIEADTP